MSNHSNLLDVEREFWQAAGDRSFYESAFADDGVMAFDIGIMAKGEVLDAVGASGAWEEFAIDDPHLIQISPDVASLTYTATARALGQDATYRAVVSSVYVSRGGRWVLVLHQQTPMRAGSAAPRG